MSHWMSLYKKDLTAEFRQPQYLLGVIFFQFCLLFMFFLFQDSNMESGWWANLFWVNLLIASMSLVLKNFSTESSDQFAYYYQLADPMTMYVGKAIYNFTLLSFAALVNFILFYLLFEPKSFDVVKFLILILVGIVGLSLSLTLVAFIAGFGQNASVLINILVLPIVIPIFLLLIRSTAAAADGFYLNWRGDVTLIAGIDILMLAMGIGLFPYLWRR